MWACGMHRNLEEDHSRLSFPKMSSTVSSILQNLSYNVTMTLLPRSRSVHGPSLESGQVCDNDENNDM